MKERLHRVNDIVDDGIEKVRQRSETDTDARGKDLASNHQHCKNKGTKVHFNIMINTGTRVLFLQF